MAVAFIDAAVKHFEPEEIAQFARLIRAMLDRDARSFRAGEAVDVLRPERRSPMTRSTTGSRTTS